MAARSTESAFPARFDSLPQLLDFVRNADVTYLVDGCRWDVITLNADDNSLTLEGVFEDDAIADGDFQIHIVYANNALHFTVSSPFHDPAVVDFVTDHFVPAFLRFPASY